MTAPPIAPDQQQQAVPAEPNRDQPGTQNQYDALLQKFGPKLIQAINQKRNGWEWVWKLPSASVINRGAESFSNL